MELEFQRNKERFGFLKCGSNAFNNMLAIPHGSGIVHQVIASFHDKWYWNEYVRIHNILSDSIIFRIFLFLHAMKKIFHSHDLSLPSESSFVVQTV